MLFETTNSSVLTVDADGKVSIVGPGFANILIKIQENEFYKESNSVEVSVTVEAVQNENPDKNKTFFVKDNDGVITLSDALMILKFALGSETTDVVYTLEDTLMCLKIALGIIELK